MDSNHRSDKQQIYSLSPLATREFPLIQFVRENAGAGRRTRTPDLLITNQLLYRLSYTGDSRGTRVLYHEIAKCQARIYKNMDFFCFAIVGFSGNRKIVIWRTGTDAPLGSPFGGNVINLRIPFQCVKIIAKILVKMPIDKSKIASKSR